MQLQTQIPVKLFVLPAIYDNVDTGVDDKEEVGEVGQEIRPEVKMLPGWHKVRESGN